MSLKFADLSLWETSYHSRCAAPCRTLACGASG